MGLTIIEKILLKHIPSKKLEDFVYPRVDFCFGNDITAPLAVKEFKKAGFTSVFNSRKIGFVCDHFLPARDMKAANNAKFLKEFAAEYKIRNYYDINHCGVEHAFLVEKGLVKPGELVIGADSHTCTYGGIGAASLGVGSTDLAAAMYTGKCWFRMPQVMKFIYNGKKDRWLSGKDLILYTIGRIGVDGALYRVMEFSGPVIKQIGIEDRLTMANMAIEAGGKTAIVEPDDKTFKYLGNLWGKNFRFPDSAKKLKSDENAKYYSITEIDVSRLEPQVACPHLPSNVQPVGALRKVKLDQVVIGSCTNGRISDLEIAAKIIKGRKVAKGLRVIILPATPDVYIQAEKKGWITAFSQAGCLVGPPNCGPCLGGHMGILGKGETALATTNRNFIGRMGSPLSFVYLSSPAVAAASAIKGRIAHPAEVTG